MKRSKIAIKNPFYKCNRTQDLEIRILALSHIISVQFWIDRVPSCYTPIEILNPTHTVIRPLTCFDKIFIYFFAIPFGFFEWNYKITLMFRAPGRISKVMSFQKTPYCDMPWFCIICILCKAEIRYGANIFEALRLGFI
jgi:hypothetical protein